MPDNTKLYKRDGRRFVPVEQEQLKDGLWLVENGGYHKRWIADVDSLDSRELAKLQKHRSAIINVVSNVLMRKRFGSPVREVARAIVDKVMEILEEE